jgi:putative PIN family toxin of toxin-antitoxin system
MPYRLLQAATDGDIELFTSPALLAELRAVLAREHLALRLTRQQSTADQVIRFYGELAIAVSPLAIPHAVPRDADDDQVIAAALAAQADLIVSGDNDLLTLGQYRGIAIVMPAQAVRLAGR